jgi:serine/threonine protein kinase
MKPGNVFLDGARRNAFLGDFGSAAQMADGRAVAIEGSPLYTAPEAGPEDGYVAVTGDIYGVGVTLYEMLNGPFPYASISPEDVEVRLARQRRALPDRLYERWDPCVPNSVRSVIRKATRRDESSRYQSCSAFIHGLQRVRCIDWLRVEGMASTENGSADGLRMSARSDDASIR